MTESAESVTRARGALATWLRRAAWPAILVAGLAAESVLWRNGTSASYVVYDLAVGFTAVFVSLIVWGDEPSNAVGPLLFLYTAWLLVSPIKYLPNTFWISVSWVAQALVVGVFAQAVLAYPTGRLRNGWDRSLVVFAYGQGVVFAAIGLLIAPSDELFGGCLGAPCPATPPFSTANPDLFARVQDAQNVVDVLLVAAFVALLLLRMVTATSRRRRQGAPVWVAGCLASASFLLDALLPQGFGGVWDANDIISHGVRLIVALAFFAGVYVRRVERARVADMLVELAGSQGPSIEPALARVLRDPSLRLGYWHADRRVCVDGDGEVLPAPSEGTDVVTTYINGDEGPLGVLIHDRAVLEDPRLIDSVVAATRLALENARLQVQLYSRLEEVRDSRTRIVQAGDDARRRLERDLHDGAQQRLLSIGLALQLAKSEVPIGTSTRGLLDEAEAELVAAVIELRDLARGIHPSVLTDHGLLGAFGILAQRSAIPVHIVAVPSDRLPQPIEIATYFVVSEAIQNTVKHAHASYVAVTVNHFDHVVHIEVCDDGIGGANPDKGSGIRGLRDRVESIDGCLTVDSPVGRGTRLRVELPCE